MQPFETRIELNETIIQELLWRALSPAEIVLMPAFNAALQAEHERSGSPPEGALLSGVSVTTTAGRMYAEIAYTHAGDRRTD